MKIIPRKTFFIATTLVASAFLFTQCDSGDEFEGANKKPITINLSGELNVGGPNNLVTDENNPSNKYSRVDSIGQYGYGAGYILPDSLKDCNLKLVLSGKMRETESITGYIAIALHGKDSIFFWGNVFAYIHVKHLNNWVTFNDSVIIPKTANIPSAHDLRIFSLKQTGKGFYDVDDLSVKITRE